MNVTDLAAECVTAYLAERFGAETKKETWKG